MISFPRSTYLPEDRSEFHPCCRVSELAWRRMPNRARPVVTIADVARACGVGTMTVSRVINGKKHVSAEMVRRVEEAIARLNYQPNEAARTLKGRTSRTIGLIVPSLSDPFFSQCAHAVQQVAAEQGYMTMLFACESNRNVEVEELSQMRSRNIAGILIVPSSEESVEQLRELRRSGMPVVMIDRTIAGIDAGEVMVENLEGAFRATSHLIDHGHRRIQCVGYDREYNSISQRIEGYRKAMQTAGLQPQYTLVKRGVPIGPKILALLRSPKPPTALFTLNNVTSVTVLNALKREEIRIPQQVALVGFDDFELASLLAVPLTAVRQPAAELGRHATRMLIDSLRVGNGGERMLSRIVLPTELILRQSCGCEPIARITHAL